MSDLLALKKGRRCFAPPFLTLLFSALFFAGINRVHAQDPASHLITVIGSVKDSAGKNIGGVSVTNVSKSTGGTYTDNNGNFVPDCDLTLITANGECQALNNNRFGTVNITTISGTNTIHGEGFFNYRSDGTSAAIGDPASFIDIWAT